jgi:hypothetical protein
MDLKDILNQPLQDKFERNYEVPDMSVEMQSLTTRQKEIADVRTGLYELVKENFVKERKELVYGINDDPVPTEVVKFSPKFWEWHKIGKEVIADKTISKKDIKLKTTKVYIQPDDPSKVISLVFQGINKYKSALTSFSGDLQRFNVKLDSVVASYTKASRYHSDRVEQLLEVKETIKEGYKESKEKQSELREKLKNEGYKSVYVNNIDSLDLKCHQMAGDLDRAEKLLERSTVYHDAFNNLARAYSSTRSTCKAVTDYVDDVKDIMTTLSNGTMEVDAFVEKVFAALSTTMEAEKCANQMLSYTRGISKQTLSIGQESYADTSHQMNNTRILADTNTEMSGLIVDKMDSIDKMASNVVEKYIGA